MWQEAERARAEVKKRGTPPSIPQGARSTFAYEEDAEGRLKRVIDEPGPAPGSLVGPGRYSPSGLSSGPRVDFKSGSGRNLPVAPGRPPTLLPGAPGWHDGLTSNPLPPQDLPSSSFALPPDALSFLAAATSDHAEADRGGGGSGGGRASGDGGGGGSCRSARPGGSQSAGVRGRAGGAVRGSASSPNLIERLSCQPPTAGEVEGGYADAGAATAHSPTDQPIAQSLVSTMPHGFRHSRGRTRERAVLAPSTGVPGANGGLLGRQMAARLGVSGELPGPGAYPLSKGGGPIGARALPRSGLPRQRPFYAAHLKALGGLPQETGPS
jgi:hypothetical protein